MSYSANKVKIHGCEEFEIAVESAPIADIANCTRDGEGERVPLLIATDFPDPVTSMLIGARLTTDYQMGLSVVEFRTQINLPDDASTCKRVGDLTNMSGVIFELGLFKHAHKVEPALTLSLETLIDSGGIIPKKTWFGFLGASFACALAINRNYLAIGGQVDDSKPYAGRFVVGQVAI
ncbi:MAG: hypothetical protein AAB914_03280 [Patescibacteria group bacterium]